MHIHPNSASLPLFKTSNPDLLKAISYIDNQIYDLAVPILKNLLHSKDPNTLAQSHLILGFLIFNSAGVPFSPENNEEGVVHFLQAEDQEVNKLVKIESLIKLAAAFIEGVGVKKDHQHAKQYLDQAKALTSCRKVKRRIADLVEEIVEEEKTLEAPPSKTQNNTPIPPEEKESESKRKKFKSSSIDKKLVEDPIPSPSEDCFSKEALLMELAQLSVLTGEEAKAIKCWKILEKSDNPAIKIIASTQLELLSKGKNIG